MGLLHGPGAVGARRSYDFVVVGSGAAGCAAAAGILERLPGASVALVERGGMLPNAWWYKSPVASHILRGVGRHRGVDRVTGRSAVLGGSSAITEGPYLFGHPDEFDAIAKDHACEQLGWSNVKGVVSALTRAAGLGLPDRSQYCSELNGLFEIACEASGVTGADLLDGTPDGYGVKPTSASRGTITSAFDSIGLPLLTTTPSFDVLTHTACTGVDVAADGTVSAVHLAPSASGGECVSVSCGRVVLCCGGIGSPTLLHDIPEVAHLPIGASVAEAFSVAINFRLANQGIKTKSLCPQNARYMWRQLQEYRSSGSGALTSVSECAAFMVSNDQAVIPDLRLDFFGGARRIMPASGPGFTVEVGVTRPRTRGHISRGATGGATYSRADAIEGFDVRVVDEGVKWATLLCDQRAELRARSLNNVHPFSNAGGQVEATLQSIEDIHKLLSEELRHSGDVFGGCAVGSVVDGSDFAVKDTKGLYVGDCSVMPGPHSGTRSAVGLIIGTLAGRSAASSSVK